jgi:hypothetical protein
MFALVFATFFATAAIPVKMGFSLPNQVFVP